MEISRPGWCQTLLNKDPWRGGAHAMIGWTATHEKRKTICLVETSTASQVSVRSLKWTHQRRLRSTERASGRLQVNIDELTCANTLEHGRIVINMRMREGSVTRCWMRNKMQGCGASPKRAGCSGAKSDADSSRNPEISKQRQNHRTAFITRATSSAAASSLPSPSAPPARACATLPGQLSMMVSSGCPM